jgi:hypothetical protein
MMRKTLVGTLVASTVLVIGGVGASVAGADAAPQVFRTITYGNMPPNHRLVVGIGPIAGAGPETIAGPMVNNPDGSTTVPFKWSFPAGNVFVTLTSFQDFQGEPVPPVCKVSADIHGTWVITGGTGAYAGVSGSGTVTGTGTVFAVFDPTTGQCSMDQANLMLNTKTYTGTVSLGNDG